MKITKKTLKQIIKEEIEALNERRGREKLSPTFGEVAVIVRAMDQMIEQDKQSERVENALLELVAKVSEEAADATGMSPADIQYMEDEDLVDLLSDGDERMKSIRLSLTREEVAVMARALETMLNDMRLPDDELGGLGIIRTVGFMAAGEIERVSSKFGLNHNQFMDDGQIEQLLGAAYDSTPAY